MKEKKKLSGPDLSKGVPSDDLPSEGMLIGHVDNEEVLLVRSRGEVFAVFAGGGFWSADEQLARSRAA